MRAKASQKGCANRRNEANEVKSREIERAGFGTALLEMVLRIGFQIRVAGVNGCVELGVVPSAIVIEGE
jgi:hypothetical protein